MRFYVEMLYSFYEGSENRLKEGVHNKWMTREELAKEFFNHHLIFIKVDGVLYGLQVNGSWKNCYAGSIEEYLFRANEISDANDWEDSLLYY